jgi:hypothetical protein
MGFRIALLLAAAAMQACAAGQEPARLRTWERGLAVEPGAPGSPVLYLWFYEWNMFDAVRSGQHTQGRRDSTKSVDSAGIDARLDLPEAGLSLRSRALADGAELVLTVTNRSDHDWPVLAGIIPCFSPGMAADGGPATPSFANEKTWFLARSGLEPLRKREIHFNERFRKAVDAEAREGRYAWSDKWPTAEPDASAGLLVRESEDGRWVTGIAWEEFLSAQGHNPWRCMHLCVRVGPLARGRSGTIRGRIYLFEGTKEDLLARFRKEFAGSGF